MRLMNVLLLAALLLPLLVGCVGQPMLAAPQKLDQLAAVWLAYKATPGTDADVQAAVDQGLQVLGVDLDTVLAVPPAATGIYLTDQLIEERPELAPYRDLIVQLYSYAVSLVAGPDAMPAATSP